MRARSDVVLFFLLSSSSFLYSPRCGSLAQRRSTMPETLTTTTHVSVTRLVSHIGAEIFTSTTARRSATR